MELLLLMNLQSRMAYSKTQGMSITLGGCISGNSRLVTVGVSPITGIWSPNERVFDEYDQLEYGTEQVTIRE